MGTVPVNKAAWIGVFLENIACFYLGDKTKSRLFNKIIGAEDDDFISYSSEILIRKLRIHLEFLSLKLLIQDL